MGRSRSKFNQYIIPDNNVFPTQAIYEPQLGQEIDLINQWFSMPIGKMLQTNTGSHLIIINHGYHNLNKGPDIKGAQLFMEGKFVKGDIECHIYERDWYAHGHDQDLNYKNVILHLIRKASQNYSPVIHTLILPYVKQWGCSLNVKNISKNSIASLKIMSSRRWREKVNLCRKENAVEQLAKPLGSGGNEVGFLFLIHTIDTRALISLSTSNQLEYIKRNAQNIEWEHCGIRPAQWPENRFTLLAELISFMSVIEEKNFTNHTVFIKRLMDVCTSGGKSILIECCINYFYPCFAAQAIEDNNHKKYKKWKHAWNELKLQNPYGKQAKIFGKYFSRKELCSVVVVQGLLQVEKEFCNPRFCKVCPIKDLNLKHLKN